MSRSGISRVEAFDLWESIPDWSEHMQVAFAHELAYKRRIRVRVLQRVASLDESKGFLACPTET